MRGATMSRAPARKRRSAFGGDETRVKNNSVQRRGNPAFCPAADLSSSSSTITGCRTRLSRGFRASAGRFLRASTRIRIVYPGQRVEDLGLSQRLARLNYHRVAPGQAIRGDYR